MSGYYDSQIISLIAKSDRPLRHREIAERLAPGNYAAWNSIGASLSKLFQAGALSRIKLDGRYWHYRPGTGLSELERLRHLAQAVGAWKVALETTNGVHAAERAVLDAFEAV